MSGRGKVGVNKSLRTSKSTKAGLIFPAARVHRFLKARKVAVRVSAGAGVYLAAVMEYLAAEVLELSGNCAHDMKKTRIIPRHILLALKSDSEFDEMLTKYNVIITQGGVPPHIMQQLLPKAPANDGSTPSSKSPAAPKKVKAAPKAAATAADSADDTDADAGAVAPSSTDQKKAGAGKKPVNRAATIENLGAKKLFLGQNLKIVKANIGKYDKTDAVVHPTNSHLSTSGMVGTELVKYGGAALQSEISAQSANLGVTQCCITGGGDLAAKFVIHCNSPSWNGPNSNSIAQLKQSIENILKLADKKNLTSVALPSIGSGNNGYPKDEAARAILQAIDSYFQSIMSSSLKEVHFVLFDDESLDVYNNVYSHEFP